MFHFETKCAKSLRFDDEDEVSYSSSEQKAVEHNVIEKFRDFEEFADVEPEMILRKDDHIRYLLRGLEHLSKGYQCLDASRPWLCYWIVHSLTLLEVEIPKELVSRTCKFLSKCQSSTGGFGGGPGQLAHLAPTYAAVNCLCTLATTEAYSVINREKLLQFLWRMRQKNGSFLMHEDGEADTRSVYCAASVAALTGLLEDSGDLFTNSPQWIVRCQSYEGGLGGCPGVEAHGGYSFCGYAALVILGHPKLLDTDRLLRWAVNRQMRLEGGFQGRINKLVDGCYSFWQGGLMPLLHKTMYDEGGTGQEIIDSKRHWLYNQAALQEYILLCCQSAHGGLLDKPGKSSDYYHTCYTLSGLSSSQHCPDGRIFNVGPRSNQLVQAHAAFNVKSEAVVKAHEHFMSLSLS